MIPRPIAEIVDAATVASDWLEYERPLFEALDRVIGFDLAFCVRADGMGPHSPGFDPRVRRHAQGRMHDYGREYEAMKQTALKGRGVAVDVEFFGRAQLERTRTYRDLIAPHRGRRSMLMFMVTPAGPVATLVLGRTRMSSFTAADCETLANARALFTVCEQAVASRQHVEAAAPELTPRERELVHYLRLGYTNREIASACGTSFRTVRNQFSRLFEKLEVSTRSEAVARSFELSLPLA